MPVDTIHWDQDGLRIIDQTLLPNEYSEIRLETLDSVWEAIKQLRVRGAPAIGVCAAFGVLVGIREQGIGTVDALRQAALDSAAHLATARPTAVNLFWALNRMKKRLNSESNLDSGQALYDALEEEAIGIYEEDKRLCRAIGQHGAPLIKDACGVLTHCNAGGLATAYYGTALAPMFRAHEEGRQFAVFADETRPLLQGARLTSWELMQAGIDVTLICDSVAAQVMREGKIDLVVVGSDRIAANGDAANKIGTYGVALLAQAHNIPFYVAAPTSTIDPDVPSGEQIPIEQRDPREVTNGFGSQTAPEGVKVYNPAFDVTPAKLIKGIVTEKGILKPPFEASIAACLASPHTESTTLTEVP